MKNYYEADDRWKIYGIANKVQFEQQFVVKGYFHEEVPNDVKDAFTTVEYLMVYAYFYWPMYDEAFNKALRLLEMAIKQKASLQGVPLKNKSFDTLINEICREPFDQHLKDELHRGRKIRNNQVHALRNTYSGVIGGKVNNIKLFVNILNELFRDDYWQKAQFEKQQAIREKLKIFENSLLVVENNMPTILVCEILGFRIIDESLLLICNPVLKNTKQALEEHKYLKPIAIVLTNFELQEDLLTGLSIEGHNIKIYKTLKVENLKQLSRHNTELNSVGKEDKAIYIAYLNAEAAWSLVELEYNYLSKTLN